MGFPIYPDHFEAENVQHSKLFDLTGRVAVITGSTKGIGLSIAQNMGAHGAQVVVSSRSADDCEAVAADITKSWARNGGGATGVACDVGDKDALKNLFERTVVKFGRIDSLVMNAAISPFRGPMSDIPDDAFNMAMNMNVRSPMWACNMVCPLMAGQGGGSVTIISSIGGLRGTTMLGAYAISKAADMQLVRNLAVEWGPKGIRSNCIAPGLVKTDFARRLWEDQKLYEKTIASYPLRRLGNPEDIAGMAVLLASDAGSFINGQTIVIDGGAMINGPY